MCRKQGWVKTLHWCEHKPKTTTEAAVTLKIGFAYKAGNTRFSIVPKKTLYFI